MRIELNKCKVAQKFTLNVETYVAYTTDPDFQRNSVRIRIDRSMDCRWHLLHIQHSHNDVCIDLQYRLENRHMVVLQSIDPLRKNRQGMDFLH